MSKAGRKCVSRVAMGVATLGVATGVAGVAATHPASISASLVDLTALIVVGSSTHPSGSGNEDFFQGKFNQPPYNTGDDLVHVNFFTGPWGIKQVLQANQDEPNAILASGWGAANASLLLMLLDAQNDPALPETVLILDNNVARPDGGFGTMNPWFALIGVNPFPTPTDTSALRVVDVGYQYDYNSGAPAVLLNPVAAVNSLVAWLYRRLNQAELDLPVNIDGSPRHTCGTANTCGITDNNVVLACPDARCDAIPPGDRVAIYVTTRGNTTYVTYTTDTLPLAQLIGDVVPFGDVIADLTEPLLTEIVNSAYPDDNPIPTDPSKHRVASLLPPPPQLTATATVDATTNDDSAASTEASESTSTSAETMSPETTSTETTSPETASPETTPTETTSPGTTSTDADSDAPREGKSKPSINVVRKSDKAVPEPVGTDRVSMSDSVGTTAEPEIDDSKGAVQQVADDSDQSADDPTDGADKAQE